MNLSLKKLEFPKVARNFLRTSILCKAEISEREMRCGAEEETED